MSTAWRAVVVLLGAACAGNAPPAPTSTPSPGPVGRPSMDPGRSDAPADAAIRYPSRGGGTQRFQLSRRDSIAVTMPSGESQLQISVTTAFTTLVWTATDSGTRMSATVDSLVADRDFPLPFAHIDSARQARWTFLRAPGGRISEVSGGPASLRGDQVRDQLLLLFPPLPEGGARPGATWSDSAVVPARVSAFEATEQASVSALAAPLAGPRGSLNVAVTRARTANGEGSQFGQTITVRATGVDTLDVVLAPDGRVLEVAGTRTTDLVVDLPAIGQSVPAHQVSYLRSILLP